ncbi:hypothetical protein BH09VER1_BH09VER1_17510 [soil metagenome]
MKLLSNSARAVRAFNLVEVVLALGVCSFCLLAMIGLLGTGMQTGKESEEQIQAANMASLLVSTRAASPTNAIANFAIPEDAMTNAYGNVYPAATSYIGLDGRTTNAANAAYQIICRAGTNATTGPGVAQVYVMLSWPAQASPTAATAKRYELLTYIATR